MPRPPHGQRKTPTRSAYRSPGNASKPHPGPMNTVPTIRFTAPSGHCQAQGTASFGPSGDARVSGVAAPGVPLTSPFT